jgi:hypothetical protein
MLSGNACNLQCASEQTDALTARLFVAATLSPQKRFRNLRKAKLSFWLYLIV